MRPVKRQKSASNYSVAGKSKRLTPSSSPTHSTKEEQLDSSQFQTGDEEPIDEEELLEQLKAEDSFNMIENVPQVENASPDAARKEPMTEDEVKEMARALQRNPRFQKIGEQKLMHAIRQMESNFQTSKFIVTTTRAKPLPRRVRVPWESWEVNELRRGVEIHGQHWNLILNDPGLRFQDRTQVDLKDKWRNLTAYRPYAAIPIRKFILVDENHEPILTDKSAEHVFNNRWPIDAAIKVATKNFIYGDSNNARIYLREIPAEGQEASPSVHVFDVWRTQEAAADIPKFKGKRKAWVGHAKKYATERFLSRETVIDALTSTNTSS